DHEDPDAALVELRASLPDNDPDQWPEVTPAGLPKDPFSDSVKLVVVEVSPRQGYLFTFRTASWWGVKSTRKLIKSIIAQAAAAPDTCIGLVPIAELGVAERTTTAGNRVYYPDWQIVDWRPVGTVLHLLGKTGQAGALGMAVGEALNQDLGEEPQ